MPKLYPARVIVNTLKRAGFEVISQKGSHIKLSKIQSNKTLTVIVPNHKEVARGTFGSILSQANLTEQEFEKYL